MSRGVVLPVGPSRSRGVLLLAGVTGLGILLTWLFWGPLWTGSGFVGGDLYPYFFPQKVLLAERLQAGEFPLWNPLTGFGYPILGESQTGAAYPPYLLAYSVLDVNTAYNSIHLSHYVLCFVGTWLLGRRLGLSFWGAVLTALVLTYGWFPPRACLEWAIVTGAWMPVAMWCAESFCQRRRTRDLVALSVVLGLQMLAGHFHLAFLTQLLVASYGLWRCFNCRCQHTDAAPIPASSSLKPVAWLGLAILLGFGVAAVQLLPAWELKVRSSRAAVGSEHDPSYGHLPPLYLTQLVAPWYWYSPHAIGDNESEFARTVAELAAPWHWFGPHEDLDERLMRSRAGGLTSVPTNKVEAHLYGGMVALFLAVIWCVRAVRGRSRRDTSAPPVGEAQEQPSPRSEALFWMAAGTLAALYATGWLLPLGRWLPGFQFFRGPGRYGIVTTLGIAILAGREMSRFEWRPRTALRSLGMALILISTVADLWLVSRMVGYAQMIAQPPLAFREQSPLRKLLAADSASVRLYAPGQNLGNLLGVSCLPVYLGIAPAEYQDPKFAGAGFPRRSVPGPLAADASFSNWLRDQGVTHVLSETPLATAEWNAELLWHGIDPLWNSAWGRRDPMSLYELRDTKGRVTAAERPRIILASANRVTLDVTVETDSSVQLRDLDYPGWSVRVDGQPAETVRSGVFRSVSVPPGSHRIEWIYDPMSFRAGMGVTLAAVVVLTLLALGAKHHSR